MVVKFTDFPNFKLKFLENRKVISVRKVSCVGFLKTFHMRSTYISGL